MKRFWSSIALAVALVTAVSGCTIVDDPPPAPEASKDAIIELPIPDYPASTDKVDTRLVITLLAGNGLEISTRNLACAGAVAVSPTDLADGDAACEIIQSAPRLLNAKLMPTDDKKCKNTGNQILADVFGESNGNHIRVSYTRDNLCNVKVWDKLTPLIGLG